MSESTKRSATMNLAYIKKLMKLVAESGVDEIEIEEEGRTIRISKSHHSSTQFAAGTPPPAQSPVSVQHDSASPPGVSHPTSLEAKPAAAKEPEEAYHEVRSPIVGTFYRAPASDADSYVEVGSAVQPGSVLCIVEAMKLMNEIESDVAGRVVKICVENGQPVEYSQTLFLVEAA